MRRPRRNSRSLCANILRHGAIPAQPCSRASPPSSARANVLTAAADVEPYLVDWRGRYRGARCAVVRPANHRARSPRSCAICADAGAPIVPQGGNTGLCGGATPDRGGSEIVLSLARMNRVRALDAANATITVEAGVTLARGAGGRRGGRPACSRCRSRPRAAARSAATCRPTPAAPRCCATATRASWRSGLEVVLADGRVLGRPARPAQGQHRLRPEAALHRRRRHARHRHRRGAEALSRAAHARSPRSPRVRDVARAVALLRALQAGARRPARSASSSCSDVALAPVAQASSRPARPAARPPVVRAGAGRRQRRTTRRSPTQVEDALGDAPSKRGVARRCRRSRNRGEQADATVGAAREHQRGAAARRPQHQARHLAAGVGDSGVPRRCASARCTRRFPGVRFVMFGHLGDGNLHYNLSAPDRRRRERVHGATRPRQPHRARPRRRARRQHQRRARHRPAEARRARALQERRSSSS